MAEVKEKQPFLRSSKQHRFEPGDPPMDLDRLRNWIETPDAKTERFARQLLARCGELVIDGTQYRLVGEKIQRVPVELLGIERQRLAGAIDKLVIEGA